MAPSCVRRNTSAYIPSVAQVGNGEYAKSRPPTVLQGWENKNRPRCQLLLRTASLVDKFRSWYQVAVFQYSALPTQVRNCFPTSTGRPVRYFDSSAVSRRYLGRSRVGTYMLHVKMYVPRYVRIDMCTEWFVGVPHVDDAQPRPLCV